MVASAGAPVEETGMIAVAEEEDASCLSPSVLVGSAIAGVLGTAAVEDELEVGPCDEDEAAAPVAELDSVLATVLRTAEATEVCRSEVPGGFGLRFLTNADAVMPPTPRAGFPDNMSACVRFFEERIEAVGAAIGIDTGAARGAIVMG
jgi:hypothetical protein